MKMDEFYTYVLSFYGKGGLYPMGATLVDVKAATKIHKHRTNIEFEGDSVDRETVRDILIEDFGYVWPVKDEDEDEPDLVEITDEHVEHMRLWAGEPNMSILEMMKSVELLQEILRITAVKEKEA